MNEQLRLLVELQKLDSRIIGKDALIKAIPSRLSTAERPLREARAAVEAHRQKLEEADKKKRDRERTLDECIDRIEKLKARIADIKDNKAYQAHLKEIEAAEGERTAIEDEILSLMEAVEAEGGELRGTEKVLEAEEGKAAELKRALEGEVEEARRELDALKEQREALTGRMDRDTYTMYMSLLEQLRGLAVVEVKGEVCQGCNMNIMPQLFVEIKKNQEIFQCPQCRRILYYDERQ